jgi:hypothetical protein
MQYIEINLFDHDIKGQGHSDVIRLHSSLYCYIYMQNMEALDIETKSVLSFYLIKICPQSPCQTLDYENSHHINPGACFCTRLHSYLKRISNVIYISVLGRCGRNCMIARFTSHCGISKL